LYFTDSNGISSYTEIWQDEFSDILNFLPTFGN
jgi:hypothetical protein